MSKRKTLSVVLITLNEAALLSDCLMSVNWADEIIVLDSGSHDETCHIAKRMGAQVFQITDWQGFGIQRQRAQSLACSDYILMIDADERVTPLLRNSIQQVLQQPIIDGVVYSCLRCNYFLGRFIRYGGWYPDRVIRLYERKHYHYNVQQVHESLSTVDHPNIVTLQGDLQHFTGYDFITFQKKQLKYAKCWAQEHDQVGFTCSLFAVICRTYGAFINTWILRAGFLEGSHGWLLAMINAQYTFNKYATLWSLNYTRKRKNI
ncbi:glycosyltransferase family 2 protein [Candidatus Curculioniphilus buchneri]|uniref:glycosyltransferase family 2 protein n=1 Tax=Candidatus Curculioniphilus buchneri TaxID=690594 RepID=UPI00376F137C